jgi:hypothetical protein
MSFPMQSAQTEQLKSVNITTAISVWRKNSQLEHSYELSLKCFPVI